jgi:hypothetical protein
MVQLLIRNLRRKDTQTHKPKERRGLEFGIYAGQKFASLPVDSQEHTFDRNWTFLEQRPFQDSSIQKSRILRSLYIDLL